MKLFGAFILITEENDFFRANEIGNDEIVLCNDGFLNIICCTERTLLINGNWEELKDWEVSL